MKDLKNKIDKAYEFLKDIMPYDDFHIMINNYVINLEKEAKKHRKKVKKFNPV